MANYDCLRKDRTGESLTMNNGMLATITDYRTNKDIEITFEGGQRVCGIAYGDFIKRKIKCPLLVERINDYLRVTNLNTCPHTVFFIDDEFEKAVTKEYWHTTTSGYVKSGKLGLLHRLVANALDHEFVDHINLDKMDNRSDNLRVCTKSQNGQNRRIQLNNKSGYKGVWWDDIRKKYSASLQLDGKNNFLGYYDDKTEAAKAYNEAAMLMFGEFALINDLEEV